MGIHIPLYLNRDHSVFYTMNYGADIFIRGNVIHTLEKNTCHILMRFPSGIHIGKLGSQGALGSKGAVQPIEWGQSPSITAVKFNALKVKLHGRNWKASPQMTAPDTHNRFFCEQGLIAYLIITATSRRMIDQMKPC